jgi:hypothetical protein
LQNQWVVGRVLTRHVGLKPDLHPQWIIRVYCSNGSHPRMNYYNGFIIIVLRLFFMGPLGSISFDRTFAGRDSSRHNQRRVKTRPADYFHFAAALPARISTRFRPFSFAR